MSDPSTNLPLTRSPGLASAPIEAPLPAAYTAVGSRTPVPAPPPATAAPTIVVNNVVHASPQLAVTPGKAPGAGSVLLNVVWLLLSGFWLCLAYLLAGLLQCLTVIGIPFGIQSFKLAGFALWPFGRVVVERPGRSASLSVAGNLIWFLLSGLWLALAHALTGALLCATIVGIPLGIANFKLIPLALTPFGKDIVKKGQLISQAGYTTVASF